MSHILLDYTVNYGVRPFFPWNGTWYAWSIVFIVDPWLLLALTLALVVPAILGLADREIGARKKRFRGRAWAIAALVFMVLWWGLRNAEHDHALALIRAGNYTREPLFASPPSPTSRIPSAGTSSWKPGTTSRPPTSTPSETWSPPTTMPT